MLLVARKFLVRGLVQGVGFRYFTQRSAARHQVLGYVRNLEDGRVEAFAQGPEAAVEAFKQDLTAGPRFSSVDDIEEFVMDLTNEFSSFRIER
ncbi:MAG: acylphosphatase [Pyrinomonadaceae bacterium]